MFGRDIYARRYTWNIKVLRAQMILSDIKRRLSRLVVKEFDIFISFSEKTILHCILLKMRALFRTHFGTFVLTCLCFRIASYIILECYWKYQVCGSHVDCNGLHIYLNIILLETKLRGQSASD